MNRFIYIKAVASLTHALQGAELVREKVSTVGLSSTAAQSRELAQQLARWARGAFVRWARCRIRPTGWRHDGRPPLGDLVTWTDWRDNDGT